MESIREEVPVNSSTNNGSSCTCPTDCDKDGCNCHSPYDSDDEVETQYTYYVTPCYYRAKYGGIWGDRFGEIFTEDKTVVKGAKIQFNGTRKYTLDTIDEYRTGERKPALNRFIIVDKTQAQYDEVPVDQYHKGNN